MMGNRTTRQLHRTMNHGFLGPTIEKPNRSSRINPTSTKASKDELPKKKRYRGYRPWWRMDDDCIG